MHAHVTRLADIFAMLGGAILFVIVMVTTTNTGAFILDRFMGLFGQDVSGLPGYEDFVQLAISGAALMFFPYTQASRGHVAVDLFVANAPMPVKRVLDHMWLTLTAAVALFLAYWMVHGMLESRSDAAEAGVLGWPIWPFYIPGIASMVLWAVVSVSQIFETRAMLDPITIGVLGLVVLFVLLILRMPVGIAMILVGIGGTYALSLALPYVRFVPYIRQFKSLLWENVASYDLSVVPLFVLMGYIAAEARLSSDLFKGLEALLSRLRGGVAMAAIAACGGFGAVCGSSLATAATMGKVALPELKELGYKDRLSAGALAAGGTLGILIPPSVALVIYAIIVEGSILKMFQAAVIPGLLAVLSFIGVIAILVRVNPSLAPEPRPMPRAERNLALKRLFPVILIFGAIILGLGFGLFTPTPAASIGVFLIGAYGFALRALSGEGLNMAGLRRALQATAITSGMIYLILFGAEVLKGFFTRSGLPQALSEWAANSGMDPMLVLVIMLIAFVVLGCFMESLAMILVVVPFFWPTLIALNGGEYVTAETAAYGMDTESLKIWFGILALIVVELGLITPPVGLNVFIISSLAKDTPMSTVFRGVMPFLGSEVIRVALILMIPALTLTIPRLIGG